MDELNRPAGAGRPGPEGSRPALAMHFVPGIFGTAPGRLLARLLEGSAGLEVQDLRPVDSEGGSGDVSDWLGSPPQGEARQAVAMASLGGRKGLRLRLETLGASPAGRLLVGLELEAMKEGLWTHKDLEIALMALACAALSGESQGAVLIGPHLGPVGVGLGRGGVHEQVRGLLEILGAHVGLIVASPDTAAGLDDLGGFTREPLGDLAAFRPVEG